MYKLLKSGIQRKADNAFIPLADGNSDYEKYKDWLAAGNVPDPEDVPDPNLAVQAEIDAVERATLMSRGAREFFMRAIEKEASATPATAAATLAAHPFYNSLKTVDAQVAALRAKFKPK